MSISHTRASQLIHADLDGSLSSKERTALEEHLSSCPQCQAEFASMAHLDEHLRISLRKHWARKNVAAAELSKITARVETGSKRRVPVLDLGLGWLKSGFQVAAIAGLAILLVSMLAPGVGVPGLSPDETGTPAEDATLEGQTTTPEIGEVQPCLVTITAPVDVWSGPGTTYDRVGTLPVGTTLTAIAQINDADQLIWLEISAADLPNGWIAGYSRQGQDILKACPSLPVIEISTDTPVGDTPTSTPIGDASPTPVSQPTQDLPLPSPTPMPTLVLLTPTPVFDIPTPTPIPDFASEPEYQASVGCSQTTITGTTIMEASQVKVSVTLASNLLSQLASVVVDIGPDGRFSATLTYPAQPEGTRLIIAFGEWDGTSYMRPATLFGEDCTG